MQGPPEHVESIQFLDEAQLLSVVALVEQDPCGLARGVTSNALVFVDIPQHPLTVILQIFQAPRRNNATQIGTEAKLLFRGYRHLAQTERRKRAGSQLSLIPSSSKVGERTLARLLGRIAHLFKSGINQQAATSCCNEFDESEKSESPAMAFKPLIARENNSNIFRWKDDLLTSSTSHQRSWVRSLK